MPLFTLTRTGLAPLRFEGEMIAEASSHGRDGPLQNRWHEIRVYRIPCPKAYSDMFATPTPDRLVAQVDFHSQWQGEHSHHTADVCESSDVLTDFLIAYDWREGWENYPSSDAYAGRRERNDRVVRGGYLRAVSEVLASFPEELGTSSKPRGGYIRVGAGEIAETRELLAPGKVFADYDAAGVLVGVEFLHVEGFEMGESRGACRERETGTPAHEIGGEG